MLFAKIPTTSYCLRLFAAFPFLLAANAVIADNSPWDESHPKAVDLSVFLTAPIPSSAKPFAFEKIDNQTGAINVMVSAEPRRFGDPDVLSPVKRNDKAQISANHKIVSRLGKALVIKVANGNVVRFVDWSIPPGPQSEGDGASYLYAGPLENTGYLQVDAFIEHDAPGSYLVNAKTGVTLFANSGDDRVSVSKSHNTLMSMNSGLNPPFGILVASLNESGHEIMVRCKAIESRQSSPNIIPFFTGWHVSPYVGFDLVLLIQQLGSGATPRYEAIPVRFSQKGSTWHVFVPEPQRFTQLTGLSCWR